MRLIHNTSSKEARTELALTRRCRSTLGSQSRRWPKNWDNAHGSALACNVWQAITDHITARIVCCAAQLLWMPKRRRSHGKSLLYLLSHLCAAHTMQPNADNEHADDEEERTIMRL